LLLFPNQNRIQNLPSLIDWSIVISSLPVLDSTDRKDPTDLAFLPECALTLGNFPVG
jgi:hypothetical protein